MRYNNCGCGLMPIGMEELLSSLLGGKMVAAILFLPCFSVCWVTYDYSAVCQELQAFYKILVCPFGNAFAMGSQRGIFEILNQR